MKKNILTIIVCFFAITINSNIHAQQPSLNDSDIEGQFKYLISHSEDFENYKMVKRWILYTFKSHVIDTIDLLKYQINVYDSIQKVKEKEIIALEKNIDEISLELKEVTKEKDSLFLIGFSVQKAVFYSIIIFVILALVLVIVIIFILYKRSNILTVKAKSELRELQDEFVAHRKSALKRHEKVVRELYDEILKYKAQLGK